jgi:thioredoxin reductase (NADPH)
MVRDVVIVGAGPAGISAAVYLKRTGLNPLVIEKDRIGGLLLNANLVENYPGFPEGISGKELVDLLKEQLDRWGVEVRRTEVDRVLPTNDGFRIVTPEGDIESQAVILATGTKPKKAGISGENRFEGQRLFYEIRDMPEENGRDYIIMGSGDAAFDYALNLSGKASKVDIVFRSSKPRCIKLLLERALNTDNIILHPESEPKSLTEKDGRLHLTCQTPDEEKEYDADYALIACGREPNLVDVEGSLDLSVRGENCETKIPGIYVVGDVRRGDYRQMGIAVGDALQAAMSIADYLGRGEE